MTHTRHPFMPGVIQHRGEKSWSRCTVCKKPGRLIRRAGPAGRTAQFWQHTKRPDEEPLPQEACDWTAAGRLWCCKAQGHDGAHHAHRGPRRNVHDAV